MTSPTALSDELVTLIRGLLAERLGEAVVKDVRVRRDQDADGDDILRVTVLVELNGDRVPAEQTRGLIRVARAGLADLGEEAFPIFSFMTPTEAKELGAAA